jgi:membrane-associated phospholipid phosphatase
MSGALAQTPATPSPTPQPSPTPTLERKFLKNILQDQRAIWTSPLHLQKEDAKWLAPLGLSTTALIATDRRTADALDDNRTRLNVSHAISYVGSGYGAGSIAGAFYLIGRATHNARARETGLLGGEALIDSGIVAAVLKSSTQRPRPRAGRERGDFFDGGLSFPSGHTIAAWSLATVVANEYRDNRLVQISAYGLATAISVSRYTGRNHFLSDVLVGSVIGYGIGRYVYRTHHDPALESISQHSPHAPSKLLPLIIPRYERTARNYGVALVWSF